MAAIQSENFTKALLILMEESFENVHGIFLDEKTSLFETLNQITAAEASILVGGKCATLAAQVKHISFYLDLTVKSVQNPNLPPADWGEIWRTDNKVNDTEWESIKSELRESYKRILDLVQKTPTWDDERVIAGAIGVVAHVAYHLGEIRQALCCLRP